MKIIVMTVLVLVVSIGAVLALGFVLPRDHSASSSIRLNSSPESVWSLVRDVSAYAEWWPNVQRVEPIPGRELEAWKQIDKRNSALPMEIVEDRPPARLVTRIIDEGMPFGGTWTYDIQPEGAGARLTITEDGSVYNPVFRVVSRYIMGHHGTMDDYLTALGAHLGEEVVPQHIES